MATRAQKTKVGLFLSLSILLIVVGLALITGLTKKDTVTYWISFSSSVLGLSDGSPVFYLGVDVGEVKSIQVTDVNNAVVEVEIERDAVTLREGVEAKLAIYSFAMGTMCVILEGGDPHGSVLEPGSKLFGEKSTFESVSAETETILEDLSQITEAFRKGLGKLEDDEIHEMINNADDLITETRDLVNAAREDVYAAVDDFRLVADKVSKVADSGQKLLDTLNERLKPVQLADMQQQLRDTLEAVQAGADALTEQVNATGKLMDSATKSVVYQTDNVQHTLWDTLQTLNASLEAVRDLVDYLEQDPSALVRGKGKRAGEQ